MRTWLSSRALAGSWAGSQSISRSISGIDSVTLAWYWRLQRAIWRSK
jgi:hypothetical protein